MKRIGIISDTHGLLRPEVKQSLKDCEAILHAGDINKPELLDELREIAPVRAVCGNADESWAESEGIALTTSLTLFGLQIGMAHTKKAARSVSEGCDIIITGHTHKYEEKTTDGQLWLNPGTCGPVRRSAPITLAVIETEGDGTFQVVKIEIPQPEDKKNSDKKNSDKKNSDKKNSGKKESAARASEEKSGGESKKTAQKNSNANKSAENNESVKKSSRKKKTKEPPVTKDLIEKVIMDVNEGIPACDIAKRYEISENTAEKIRWYYIENHGIDAEGVLSKIMS